MKQTNAYQEQPASVQNVIYRTTNLDGIFWMTSHIYNGHKICQQQALANKLELFHVYHAHPTYSYKLKSQPHTLFLGTLNYRFQAV